MQVNITARHLQLTPAIADYVQKKVLKVKHYFDRLVWGQVILSVEKYRHIAEFVLHIGRTTLRAKEEAGDLYAAVDQMMDKMEIQVIRYKDKLKAHRKGNDNSVVLEENISSEDLPAKFKNKPAEKFLFDIVTLSISQAILQLQESKKNFLPFRDSNSEKIQIVFLRDDGEFALMILNF